MYIYIYIYEYIYIYNITDTNGSTCKELVVNSKSYALFFFLIHAIKNVRTHWNSINAIPEVHYKDRPFTNMNILFIEY
jgi:hypothetical protein